MAKEKANQGAPRGRSRLDLQNLAERDKDFLSLETKDVMKMYKVDKQAVYDRRHLLTKKIKEANLTVEEVLKNSGTKSGADAKKASAKVKPEPTLEQKPEQKQEEKTEQQSKPEEHHTPTGRDIVPYEKPLPVIMKPIEINFETFSIKLNGVPKKISVNPDTNAIEIDL